MRIKFILFPLIAALALPLSAAPAPEPLPGQSKLLLHKLLGLVITGDPNKIVKAGVSDVAGVKVLDIPFLDQADFRARVTPYIDQPFTEDSLSHLIADIKQYYRDKGRPVVDVGAPEQNITKRVLQLVVLAGKVGEVRVEGNRWFKANYLAGQFSAKPGEDIQTESLMKDLDWINRNPFRQVDLVYAKGSEFGTTDLILRETDRFPLRGYAGYDNSGTSATDQTRWITGFNWGNVFNADGQFNYQFMGSPNVNTFRAHSASYIQPLPWRHILTVFGSYANTQANVPAPLDLSGYDWQASMRYEIPLPSNHAYHHSIAAGFDFKRTNNNLLFGGETIFSSPTDTVQWNLGYDASLKDDLGATTLRATVIYSPGFLSPDDNNQAYQASRAGATATYEYEKLELNRVTGLPKDFSMISLATFQASDAKLLSSEQLGFGGYDTIRGFQTRFVNADQGYILSQEFRTPPMQVLKWIGLRDTKDQFQFLGFVDYGAAYNRGDPTKTLLGVGPGIRYSIAQNLTVRTDYGVPILHGTTPQWHAGATLSF